MSPCARIITTLLVVAASPCQLRAQSQGEVDPRLFDAVLSPGSLIGLESAWIPAHLQRWVGLGIGYANDELVGRDENGERVRRPLGDRSITTLGFGLGLFDALELQLSLPFHNAGAERVGAEGGAESAFGLGDLRAAVRWAIVRPVRSGVGLAAQLGVFFPTGGKVVGSSDGALVLDPRLVLDWRSEDGIALALVAGYRVRPERVLFDLAIDDEIRFGAGIELPLGAFGSTAPVAVLAEVEGALGLGEDERDPSTALSARKRPIEARLGLRVFGERWALTFASGTGLSSGYGTPDLRFFVGFALAPGPLEGPRPEPPERRVGAPDLGPAPKFAEAAGFADTSAFDEAMRADPDADFDGVPVPADLCPSEPEDQDGHRDDDGCPDFDNDGDGVLDAADKCPTEAEVPNGVDDEDGCPDVGQVTVIAKEGVIELAQTIEFNSGSDVLAASAAPLIAQIAAVLKANAHIKRVRIEGHTDGDGDSEMNVDLSERRAARVRQKLIELGVDPGRLLPRGFGATRGIASNATPEGRKKNRRVEFRVIDPPPPGAPKVEFEEVP